MSDSSKRVKNPYPVVETPVQLKKRVKAQSSPTLQSGSSASAVSLPSESGTPKKATTKKASAKKTAAAKAVDDK